MNDILKKVFRFTFAEADANTPNFTKVVAENEEAAREALPEEFKDKTITAVDDLGDVRNFRDLNAETVESAPKSEQEDPAEEGDDMALLGSNVQPATFGLVDGSTLQLGTVVGTAFERSGLKTAKEWNTLPDEEREEKIAAVVAELPLATAPGSSGSVGDEDEEYTPSEEEQKEIEDLLKAYPDFTVSPVKDVAPRQYAIIEFVDGDTKDSDPVAREYARGTYEFLMAEASKPAEDAAEEKDPVHTDEDESGEEEQEKDYDNSDELDNEARQRLADEENSSAK